MRRAICLLVLAMVACKRRPVVEAHATAPPAAPAPSASVVGENPLAPEIPGLAMAEPEVTSVPVPARFSAALPVSDAAFESHPTRYPPPAFHVSARLCAGDEEMQARVVTGWRNSLEKNEPPMGYQVYERGCLPLCRWALNLAEDTRLPKPLRSLAFRQLSDCYEPEGPIKRAMSSADAPADVVTDWLVGAMGEREVGFFPSMRRVLEHGASKVTFGQRLAAVAVGETDDPEVAKLLLDYHAGLQDPARAEAVAIGMHKQSDPRARQVFLAACRQAKKPDGLCPRTGAVKPGWPQRVMDYGFDPEAHLRKYPAHGADMRAALDRCISAPPTTEVYHAAWCLQKLARVDWSAARARARGLHVEARHHAAGTMAALARFESSAAMLASLRRDWALGPIPPGKTPTDVISALEAGGRALHFDTETGSFPNDHDDLMVQLARLAGEAFKGAVFEEVSPPTIDSLDDYNLRVYADGSRYEVEAENLGDWYDVDAVLGLLNAVLLARRSAWRLAVVPTGGQDIYVVAAPTDVLLRSVKSGWLDLGLAREAVDAGKQFEDRAREAAEP